MIHTISLSPEIETKLEVVAARRGQAPEEYLQTAVEDMLVSVIEQSDHVPTDWDALDRIIDSHQMKTGIPDLAHQHDHYIHGTPKRD